VVKVGGGERKTQGSPGFNAYTRGKAKKELHTKHKGGKGEKEKRDITEKKRTGGSHALGHALKKGGLERNIKKPLKKKKKKGPTKTSRREEYRHTKGKKEKRFCSRG